MVQRAAFNSPISTPPAFSYYALSASITGWTCSNFPGSTMYNMLWDSGSCKVQGQSNNGPGYILGLEILAAPVGVECVGVECVGVQWQVGVE